jgi:hypothetical protein
MQTCSIANNTLTVCSALTICHAFGTAVHTRLPAAATMTTEDIAAKQQAMTAVKDACIAAVISGVLHVYSHVTDSKGNKLPLTRSKVAQHLNK